VVISKSREEIKIKAPLTSSFDVWLLNVLTIEQNGHALFAFAPEHAFSK